MKSKINKKAMTYLGILCLTCLVFYYLSIRSGGLSGGSIFLIALMWMPAFAAVCTKLLYDHSIKGIGWRIKGWRQIGIAYVLPLVSCIVVYGLTWLTGMGGCQPVGIMPFLIMATLGLFGSMITAVGEEIGWRGIFADGTAPDAGLRTVKLGHRDHMVRLSYAADRFLRSIRGIRGILLPNLASVLPCATRRWLPLSGAGMRNAIFLVKCSK